MLAGVAGLSMHHFARQFKQSAGVTPHIYLTQKRVERAQEMLVQTNLSLAEIAFAVGRPRSSSASFPPYARYYSPRVSVVATLETTGA
jgi:transcriptional regulator GlxA family with amidase domain